MRLWSVHPSLLDRRALVACWREGLLAQKVLLGETAGYTRHPQLRRFRATSDPVLFAATYLHGVADEADRRGYRFDRTRLARERATEPLSITVTRGQLRYEFEFLLEKVLARDPEWARSALDGTDPDAVAPHPLFVPVPGPVAEWEKVRG
ncbi:pyrimidine dimer DNA glycosylase/endonuclease V [Kocuria sp.]|uniref:pyrimidine dimer DNA glycosylase/endonuclease V n=1 Tax=Kocuria sp. TaxID=1871328 RepID=UPI0026DD7C8A|nr:pyrimidine dimer DNA glycosylase/endonuclease V [Kocuria sp.]MDO4919029.1 pyrimidine dimer DNA glycosylase/endonuclease V [Kocuria sp.]